MLHFIHRPFEALASTLGASADEVKLIFSFLISYPLAALLKRIPDSRPDAKNLFSISVSLFYLVGLFDLWGGFQTLLISAVGIYCIAKFLRSSPYMPWVGFVFVMGHMSVSHIARQAANDPSSVDVTGTQMVLLMKLSAFCWNVADGQLSPDLLSDFQRDHMLKELPSLLDYAGWVLFFPALFAGPSFDFTDYRRWLNTSMFDISPQVDPSKKPPVRRKRRIPRSGGPAAWKAFSGLFWIGLFMALSSSYNPGTLTADSFVEYGFLRRVWIMHVVSFVARLKYYGVWSLTEGSCILTGLGYNGVDPVTGKISWNRLQNIDPWAVETAQNPRGYLGGWNINTSTWLRNYIYLRVTPRGKKPGFRASMATFGTSALWHGFYPGYYLSFILASFIQTVAKNFRRHVRPFFLEPITGNPTRKKKYYDFFSYLATQLTFSFTTAPFLVLSLSGSILAWRRVYFYAIIWTFFSLVFFSSPGKAALRKQLEKRQGKVSAKLVRSISTESLTGKEPILGISKDIEGDINEAVEEIRAEVRSRQQKQKAK
ncbi:MBOAT, membrane-bound O-acyltransferase family-domain-containing protein [Dactylonectria macrodidyma]|uniref:MBOAT, membrane-bound O-acyltransferase family-domain-containing protein n=1 Tax=Dactylonectria macrodidyma TaxID=307937 RepID=A0A9P9EMT7_9HYPO|nr:MBOAT, membrane-bound O-acyltransferase family-domain-containing protein [Dactylonectria macrodidyma]